MYSDLCCCSEHHCLRPLSGKDIASSRHFCASFGWEKEFWAGGRAASSTSSVKTKQRTFLINALTCSPHNKVSKVSYHLREIRLAVQMHLFVRLTTRICARPTAVSL